jgi:hypothetical protein
MLPLAQFVAREAARYPAGGARQPRPTSQPESPRAGVGSRVRAAIAARRAPRRAPAHRGARA